MLIAWWNKKQPDIISIIEENALPWNNANWIEKRPALPFEVQMRKRGIQTYHIKNMVDGLDIKIFTDLTKKIKKGARKPSQEYYRILDLFKIANRPLSLDEVCVGYYRRYKEIRKRSQIRNRLYQMTIHGPERLERLPGIWVYKLRGE